MWVVLSTWGLPLLYAGHRSQKLVSALSNVRTDECLPRWQCGASSHNILCHAVAMTSRAADFMKDQGIVPNTK